MAGLTDMPKVLLLLMVVAVSCRAQAPTAAAEPVLISQPDTCTFVDPSQAGCDSILLLRDNRTTISNNSIRFKAKFGAPGITKVTVVVSIPDTLKVKKISMNCQRKMACDKTKSSCSTGTEVIASAMNARGIDLKIFFTGPVKDIPITGTVWTSCSEKLALGWNTAPPSIIEVPQVTGPQPVGAPLSAPEPTAGGPTP